MSLGQTSCIESALERLLCRGEIRTRVWSLIARHPLLPWLTIALPRPSSRPPPHQNYLHPLMVLTRGGGLWGQALGLIVDQSTPLALARLSTHQLSPLLPYVTISFVFLLLFCIILADFC